MKIHDITRNIFRDDIVYPGDPVPSFVRQDRGRYFTSELCFCSHSGTHIDAPSHAFRTGMAVDALPLTALIGRCRVLDVRDAGNEIAAPSLKKAIGGYERILFRTSFSGKNRFDPDYPHLTPDAADLLSGHSIRCVGIDSPSIEAYNGDGALHRVLLRSGCIIIELLDLARVKEGEYTLVALPLRLSGVDGSPARVVLIEQDG